MEPAGGLVMMFMSFKIFEDSYGHFYRTFLFTTKLMSYG